MARTRSTRCRRLWSALLWPRFPPTHDLVGDAWLHAVYGTLFLYGWWLGTDAGLWAELRRLRRRSLAALRKEVEEDPSEQRELASEQEQELEAERRREPVLAAVDD